MSAHLQSEPLPTHLRKTILQTPRFRSLEPWVNRLTLISNKDKTLTFSFHDHSLHDLFTEDLTSLFKEAVTSADPETSVHIIGPSDSKTVLNQPYQGMTFSSFICGGLSRLVIAAAKTICDTPGQAYNPLFIHAGVGLGKTHMLHAIHNAILEAKPDLSVGHIQGDRFASLLFDATDKGKLSSFRSTLSSIDVLLFDDVHKLQGKPNCQMELLHLTDTMHEQSKQIVFTSISPASLLSGFDPSLVSRMQWGLMLEIYSPSPELRTHVICTFSNELSLNLDDSIIDYLAKNTFGPIRELQGILTALHSRITFLDEKPTLQLARELLATMSQQPNKMISLSMIDQFICDRYSISQNDLFSKTRTRSIAFPRQIAMYLAQTLTSSSLEEIGRHYGGRDHSTVKHGCEKIKKMMESDQPLRNVLTDFRHMASKS